MPQTGASHRIHKPYSFQLSDAASLQEHCRPQHICGDGGRPSQLGRDKQEIQNGYLAFRSQFQFGWGADQDEHELECNSGNVGVSVGLSGS